MTSVYVPIRKAKWHPHHAAAKPTCFGGDVSRSRAGNDAVRTQQKQKTVQVGCSIFAVQKYAMLAADGLTLTRLSRAVTFPRACHDRRFLPGDGWARKQPSP